MRHSLGDVELALGDRYRIQRMLGQGGMASVYLARELASGREVAVKVLRPELAATMGTERFQREISILSRFSHPNILPLLNAGAAGRLLYLVTPFAPGDSLRAMLKAQGRLPMDRAVAIALDMAAGLDYIHAQGVVHRDIKPENILFDGDRSLLCDFGVARAVVVAAGDSISSSGLILGTPAYMSPEQASGKGDLDGRSDIYALACVVHEMLAGEPPFTGRTAQAVMAKQAKEPPPRVSVLRPEVPAHVERCLLWCLAKLPADRPGHAGEITKAISPPNAPPHEPRELR